MERKIRRVDVVFTDGKIESVFQEPEEQEPDWTGDDPMIYYETPEEHDPFQEEENPFLIDGYDGHKDPARLVSAAITETFPDLFEVFEIAFDGPQGHEEKLEQLRAAILEKVKAWVKAEMQP